MTGKTLLSSQVKGLLSSVSEHGAQHLNEIESDLKQTDALLSEAIDKLCKSFLAIQQAVSDHQATVEQLLSGMPADKASQLQSSQSEIAQHVNAAVTGLQFQDMTSQLFARTVRRVTGLREALEQIGASSSDLPDNNEPGDIVATLESMNTVLNEQSAKLEGLLWKAVCQTHMESGDVELF
jgi:hypothetical protein